jgi:RES domain-containing protein
MRSRRIQQLLEAAPTVPYARLGNKSELLVRCVPKRVYESGTPPNYLFASGGANRCNPAGVFCIYLSETRETAEVESDSYYLMPEPMLVFYCRIQISALLDFTDPHVRNYFGLTKSDLTGPAYRLDPNLSNLQQIGGEIAAQKRIAAVRYPSNQMRKLGKQGHNIVVYQEALSPPDYLEVLEGDRVLNRWPEAGA